MSPVSSVSSVLTENHEKLVGRANTQSNALRNIKNDCINRIPSKSLPVIVDIFPLLPLFVTIFQSYCASKAKKAEGRGDSGSENRESSKPNLAELDESKTTNPNFTLDRRVYGFIVGSNNFQPGV